MKEKEFKLIDKKKLVGEDDFNKLYYDYSEEAIKKINNMKIDKLSGDLK